MQLESPGAQVDVVLTLAEMKDELSGTLTYCSDLFSHETALRMVKHLQVGRHRLGATQLSKRAQMWNKPLCALLTASHPV